MKKKKRAEKAQRKHGKETKIAQRMRARENRSDMEAELKSEEPMELCGDASSSEDGDRDIIVTSSEGRESAAMSASGERDVGRYGDVPPSKKRAASSNAASEQEVKRPWSPWPSEASPASPPLHQAWRGVLAGRRSMLVPLHL